LVKLTPGFHSKARLSRKYYIGLTNNLAYHDTELITGVKRFATQASGLNLVKFYVRNLLMY
jgi:hypothetical protein